MKKNQQITNSRNETILNEFQKLKLEMNSTKAIEVLSEKYNYIQYDTIRQIVYKPKVK